MEREVLDETRLREVRSLIDGRDEMNLAEFPLGVLADRVPSGLKTLTFEDRIFDHGRGDWQTRRLTVTASDKYGLPTALDDEVILGLIQVSREEGFEGRKVDFTRFQLLRTLGWRDEGRSYRRIDQSLKRWMGVTLYYEKAWWDKATETWVDESFHILEQVTLRHGRDACGDSTAGASSFTWNEAVFKSFRAGYLKRLDFTVLRNLSSKAARRMYRFLDKRFWHTPTWEFDLVEFACDKIGFSRNYDASQLKRKLLPAFRELEGARFLAPLTVEERFHREGRGKWTVVLTRQPHAARNDATGVTALVELLTTRGVAKRIAKHLVSEHDEEYIREQVAAFDARVTRQRRSPLYSPGGYLVKAIQDGYATRGLRRARPLDDIGRTAPVVTKTSATMADDSAAVTEYLNRLSSNERTELERDAIASSKATMRAGYERSVRESNDERAREYLKAMVAVYVKVLLKKQGKPEVHPPQVTR